MKFGTDGSEDDGNDGSQQGSESGQPNNWARVYHRDLVSNL
jgi:hypothetical protein